MLVCVKKNLFEFYFKLKKLQKFEKKERRKQEKKRKEKKVGCLIFEHEIEEVRGFFLAENRVPNPLI